MNTEKMPPGSGNPQMDRGHNAPYPQAATGGNYQAPPAYTAGPQVYQPGGTQHTVIMTPPGQMAFIVGSQLNDYPGVIVCPACHGQVTTRVEYSVGLMTWLMFGILCVLGCWFGCCLIPFCVDSCKDVDHYCPNCNHHIYKFKRM